MPPEMHLYAVGELYHPNHRQWPEAIQYLYHNGGHELLLFWADPKPEEIEAIRSGECEFALLAPARDVLFLLYRFGSMDWSDQPYSWWLVPANERTLPNPEPGTQERALLSITLVDSTNGLIRALRAVSLSPEMTAELHKTIRIQARTAWAGPEAYDKQIARLYRRYPDGRAMLADATARCGGGD